MPELEPPDESKTFRLFVDNRAEFLRFLERRVESRSVAEDLLQEVFVRALDPEHAPDREETALGWFYRVLRNAVIDHHRRRASAARGLAAFAGGLETALEPDIETRGALCRCIGELATTLKPEYRAAIEQVEVEGRPIGEFAADAGISSNNARVRVFRAREALKKRVAKCCGSCAEHGCVDCTCRHEKGSAGKP
jgi:RNA polymerase sigma-70 factor (ECF subfamily)